MHVCNYLHLMTHLMNGFPYDLLFLDTSNSPAVSCLVRLHVCRVCVWVCMCVSVSSGSFLTDDGKARLV